MEYDGTHTKLVVNQVNVEFLDTNDVRNYATSIILVNENYVYIFSEMESKIVEIKLEEKVDLRNISLVDEEFCMPSLYSFSKVLSEISDQNKIDKKSPNFSSEMINLIFALYW